MKRIISFLLVVCLIFGCVLSLGSCDLLTPGEKEEEKDDNVKEPTEFNILTWNIYLGNGSIDAVSNVLNDKLPDIIQLQEANPLAYTKYIIPFLNEHPE